MYTIPQHIKTKIARLGVQRERKKKRTGETTLGMPKKGRLIFNLRLLLF
jgi:hypothetical protein